MPSGELAQRWLELLPHHHILDAIEIVDDTLLLRYAAIDWELTPLRDDQRIATWGLQLVDIYMLIAAQFPGQEAHFVRPLITFDVAARIRVGFMPSQKRDVWIPSDVTSSWPACDEPGLVYAVAYALRDVCIGWNQATSEPVRSILERALGRVVRYRYPSLASLRAAFEAIASPPLDDNEQAALVAAEEGIGWLNLGDPVAATPRFLGALKLCPTLFVAQEGLARCHALRHLGEVASSGTAVKPITRADAHESRGQLLAAARRYDVEARAASGAAEQAIAHVGAARCRLALGDASTALGSALAALAVDPRSGEALSIGARAAMSSKRYVEAIGLAQRRLAIDDTDAGLYYVLGRALLVRKRFIEARDAFDRACTLEPKRIEAMLLRREADRCARRVADAVGTARPMTIDLPEHLMAMRDPLAAGRVDEVIPQLELLVDDGAAQLVLAECLAYAQRYDEALGVYGRAAELDPSLRARSTISRARALLFLERADEALAALTGFEGKDANELRAMIRERLN